MAAWYSETIRMACEPRWLCPALSSWSTGPDSLWICISDSVPGVAHTSSLESTLFYALDSNPGSITGVCDITRPWSSNERNEPSELKAGSFLPISWHIAGSNRRVCEGLSLRGLWTLFILLFPPPPSGKSSDTEVCVSQFSVAITKCLRKSTYKEGRVIWLTDFIEFPIHGQLSLLFWPLVK